MLLHVGMEPVAHQCQIQICSRGFSQSHSVTEESSESLRPCYRKLISSFAHQGDTLWLQEGVG